MNLVWFLTVGAILSIVLGEFGQYPFGSTTFSVSLTDIFTGVIMMLLLIWQVQTKTVPKELPKFFLLLGSFWAICLLSLLVSLNFSGSAYLVRFFIYSSVVYLGYSLINAKVVHYLSFVKVIFISGIVLSFLGFIQLIYYPDLEPFYQFGYDPHKARLFATFLDPNLLGSYLNLGVVMGLLLYWKNRSMITLLSLGLIIAAIILTFSRSAYLMLLIELFIFFAFYSRRVLIGLMVLMVFIVLIVGPVRERIIGAFFVDKSASERFVSWQNGGYLISQKPILGVGFNNIREAQIEEQLLKTYQNQTVNSGSGFDSSLLFVGATTGIIGLIAYLGMIGYFCYSIIKKVRGEYKLFAVCFLALTFGIVANSQFINSLFFTPVVFVFYLLIGVWFATTDTKS